MNNILCNLDSCLQKMLKRLTSLVPLTPHSLSYSKSQERKTSPAKREKLLLVFITRTRWWAMGLLSSNCLFYSSQKADKAPLVTLSLKDKNDSPNRNSIVRVSLDQIEDYKPKKGDTKRPIAYPFFVCLLHIWQPLKKKTKETFCLQTFSSPPWFFCKRSQDM